LLRINPKKIKKKRRTNFIAQVIVVVLEKRLGAVPVSFEVMD